MNNAPQRPLSAEHYHDVGLGIILSLVTCLLYSIYWNYREFKTMNELLGRNEYNFWLWAVLTILTCGLFHVYYEYKMGWDIVEILRAHGHEPNPNLPYIGLGLSLFGLTIIADAIYQHEINSLIVRP